MDPIELVAALTHPNVWAFTQMIRLGEGTRGDNGYRTLFGGDLFVGFADHPRRKITRGPLTSTAAGAYQFLERTWDGLVKQYGFADFSPKNQDLGCVALVRGRRALDDVIAGRFEQAVMKCNKEWASLPGSPYGQPVVTMAQARAEYERQGGAYAPQSIQFLAQEQNSGRPLNGEPPPANPFLNKQESVMAPFLAAAIPAVVQAVPELVKLFGAAGAITERNAKAAEVVATIAKSAIGAKNEQELVEALASDPQAAGAVRQAVKDNWFQLQEVGGGVEAAREASAKAAEGPGFWLQPAFWITVLLLPLVYFVVVKVLTSDSFTTEVQSMVVAAVVSGVLGSLSGFWLGTSFSSLKKDERRMAR